MAKKKRYHESKLAREYGRRVPATVAEDMKKLANLPTEAIFAYYPGRPYIYQDLDDSINYSDMQIAHDVDGSRKQIARKKY